MKVKDLIAQLNQQDPEMEVIADLHSDYSPVELVHVIHAVPKGSYIMRPHHSMSEENKAKLTKYVYLS